MAFVYFIAHTDGTIERKATKHGTKHIDLDEFTEAVGGHIEIVRPVNFYMSGDGNIIQRIRMIINETGKWEKLPINPIASIFYQPGNGDYIVGDVVFTLFDFSDGEPDCVAIDDKELIVVNHFGEHVKNLADHYENTLRIVKMIHEHATNTENGGSKNE